MPQIITSLQEFEEFCRKQKESTMRGLGNVPPQRIVPQPSLNRFDEFQQKSAKVQVSQWEDFQNRSQKRK